MIAGLAMPDRSVPGDWRPASDYLGSAEVARRVVGNWTWLAIRFRRFAIARQS